MADGRDQEGGTVQDGGPVKADYKVTPSDQWMKIDKAREACRAKLREIERAVNAETTGEESTS